MPNIFEHMLLSNVASREDASIGVGDGLTKDPLAFKDTLRMVA